jgi:hypothetical protein
MSGWGRGSRKAGDSVRSSAPSGEAAATSRAVNASRSHFFPDELEHGL